jgi:predicted metal-dependent HD superfamily phosphohydrolase
MIQSQSLKEKVSAFIESRISNEYGFHDLSHTQNVVDAVQQIGLLEKLPPDQLEKLEIASWWHDAGYYDGYEDHEERSAKLASVYLKEIGKSDWELEVSEIITATKPNAISNTIEQKIIQDADMSHLGSLNFWDRNDKLRRELAYTRNKEMTDIEWVDFEIDFLGKHQWQTTSGFELYEFRKQKHLKALRKQKLRLEAAKAQTPEELLLIEQTLYGDEKTVKKERARGADTLYRTLYRTQLTQNSQADSKANIMLSINAVVISVAITYLLPRLKESTQYIIPTIILITISLISYVLATLSTRPKIIKVNITKEDLVNRKVNFLFFGNLPSMSLEQYKMGMNDLIDDEKYLFDLMNTDAYFRGLVLAKKYKYLRLCYNVFMYGFVFAVLAFGFFSL